MKEENNLPSREFMDKTFHMLQDQITRITVEEEEEMMKSQLETEKKQ